jgi:hypothetical protein
VNIRFISFNKLRGSFRPSSKRYGFNVFKFDFYEKAQRFLWSGYSNLKGGDCTLPKASSFIICFFLFLIKKIDSYASSLRESVTFFKSFKLVTSNLCTQSRLPPLNLIFMWWATEERSMWSLSVCDRCSLNRVLIDLRVCPMYLYPQLLVQFIFEAWKYHPNII